MPCADTASYDRETKIEIERDMRSFDIVVAVVVVVVVVVVEIIVFQ